MPLSDRRRSISPVRSLHSERRRSDPCPVEAENPNEDWSDQEYERLIDALKGIPKQPQQKLIYERLLTDALEILKETKRPDK